MSRNRNKLSYVLFGLLVLGAAGCELLVDFDRTKIDAGPLDGTVGDVVTPDVTQDTNVKDVVNDVTPDVTTTDASDAGDASQDVTDASTADVDDGSMADADDGSADAADE